MTDFHEVMEVVYTAIKTLPEPVSADIRQRGDVIPAVIYTMDSAEFTRTAVASVAPVHVRMRFDCLHDSRIEAEDLATAVLAKLTTSNLIVAIESNTTDLFSRGADIEPVYLTSSVYVITCEGL